MKCPSFKFAAMLRALRIGKLRVSLAMMVGLGAAAVAHEQAIAQPAGEADPADVLIARPGDEPITVPLTDPLSVKTKKEQDATRQLRDAKALLADPSLVPGNAPNGGELKRQIQMLQSQEHELAEHRKQLETKLREAIQSLDKSNQDPRRVQELQQIEAQRSAMESQNAQLQLQRQYLQIATQAAAMEARQKQQVAPLPKDAETQVYALKYSRAPEIAGVLANVLGSNVLRIAVDARTNSLVVCADKETCDIVEALLMRLDQSAEATQAEKSGDTLQLRIVWLLDDSETGTEPSDHVVSSQVIEALHDLGLNNPKVVCQQVTTLTLSDEGRRGQFNFTVPVLIDSQPWRLEGTGRIESMADNRFNLAFNLGYRQQTVRTRNGGAEQGQSSELGGSIYTPLGHYTVMGTTTFVATSELKQDPQTGAPARQQHLSAFVVYLDRAQEYPAPGATSKPQNDVRR